MIYALLDFDTLKKYDISIKDFLKTAKGLKAKFVQYRDKNSSIEEKKERIKEIKKYWKKTLIVNDNVELLDLADGIHIGQEDLLELIEKFNLSAYEVVEFLKRDNKIVGLSTHNKEEILKANKMDLDYIGLGAYRPTTTKDVSSIGGEELLKIAKLSIHPVAIIGGVRLDDELDVKYKVIGSDICKSISTP